MADVVQYRLEQMVDELDDFERKGIFTRQEIAEIVKKRRNFEYKLKRPSPLKEDFLAYIEYEKHLDSLRRLRKKSASRKLVEMGKKKFKRSVSDYAGVNRTLRVFRLATMRFKGDIQLWFHYLEFCREHGHGRMNKVLAQVLRLHPKRPGLWIYAAAWEFDHNLNVAAARALMQNGLRACPNSEDLWVEYLRMELTYLNKLKARKALLGEDKGTLIRDHEDDDQKEWIDENKDLFMSLDEEKSNDVQQEESEDRLNVFQEQASSFLQVVYSEAIEALPASMNLRKRFLEILDDLDLPDSDNLREEIVTGMKKDFAKDPEYWDWLARVQILDHRQTKNSNKDLRPLLDKAVCIYEEAIKVVPSAKMFSLYTKFLMDAISPQGDDSQSLEIANTSDLISDLLKVYEKADSMGCMLEDLAYQYISLYLRLGRLEEARTMSEKLCTGKLSKAVKLWELRISIEIRWITSKSPLNKVDLESTFKLVRSILSKVPISEADSLWQLAIKFFSNHREHFDKLVETFMGLTVTYTEGGFSVSSAIVNFTLQRDGIRCARDMYKRFLALPHPSLALHHNCIELESNLAFVGDKDGLANARKVYESAVTRYSQEVGLWRDYYSLENKLGTSETANAVYWRARKILGDSSGLIAPQHL
ncbi:hypothetical protein ACHQM5_002890 [Ranunculus cassubicifolius]